MRPYGSRKKRKSIQGDEPVAFGEQAKQFHADVQGSYTGNPLYDEEPIQDADDL